MHNLFNEQAVKTITHLTDKKYVVYGNTSLDNWGLTLRKISTIEVLTSKILLNGVNFLNMVIYHYSEDIDYENYLTPCDLNNNILFPTRERAIVENIKHGLNAVDEGTFIEALYRYKDGLYFNYNLLLEVANHFNVPKDKIDYWLEECEEVDSWG